MTKEDQALRLFWENVDYYRKIQKISWTYLGKSDMMAYRAGTRRPGFNKIIEIAGELEVNPAQLLDNDKGFVEDLCYNVVCDDLGTNKKELQKAVTLIKVLKDEGVKLK